MGGVGQGGGGSEYASIGLGGSDNIVKVGSETAGSLVGRVVLFRSRSLHLGESELRENNVRTCGRKSTCYGRLIRYAVTPGRLAPIAQANESTRRGACRPLPWTNHHVLEKGLMPRDSVLNRRRRCDRVYVVRLETTLLNELCRAPKVDDLPLASRRISSRSVIRNGASAVG